MTKADGLNTARMWGALLRRFRLDAGVTQAGLAAHVGYTTDFAHSIELGRRMPSPVFVAEADGRESRRLPHRNSHPPHPRKAPRRRTRGLHGGKEDRPLTLGLRHPRPPPAPPHRAIRPNPPDRPPTPPPGHRHRHPGNRQQQRQERLTGEPACSYAFIIEEWILHRPTGEPTTMKAQLAHLLALAELRNLTLQVMPISHHTHAGLDGPLTLLETPAHTWLAHIHAHDTHHLTNDPRHLSILHSRYTYLRSHALTPTDSTQLIQKLAEQL